VTKQTISPQQEVLVDEMQRVLPAAVRRFTQSEGAVTPRVVRNLIFLNAYAAALVSDATEQEN
jgi:hypothetical protein